LKIGVVFILKVMDGERALNIWIKALFKRGRNIYCHKLDRLKSCFTIKVNVWPWTADKKSI